MAPRRHSDFVATSPSRVEREALSPTSGAVSGEGTTHSASGDAARNNGGPRPSIDWQHLAEERIRAAQAEGLFDRLPGFGQPIPGLDEPHDDLWWVKNKLKEEQLSVLPPALEIRLDVQKTLARLAGLQLESQVRQEVTALNERIRKASFANVSGPSLNVMPLEVDEIVNHWRDSRSGKV